MNQQGLILASQVEASVTKEPVYYASVTRHLIPVSILCQAQQKICTGNRDRYSDRQWSPKRPVTIVIGIALIELSVTKKVLVLVTSISETVGPMGKTSGHFFLQ